jgi:hypothetical protein
MKLSLKCKKLKYIDHNNYLYFMLKRKISTQNKPNKKVKDQLSYDRFNEKLNLLKAAREGNVIVLKNILNKRLFDYNLLNDYENNNILHISVIKEDINCIQEILKKKDFVIHELNDNKYTAFDIVAKKIKYSNIKKINHTKLMKYFRISYIIVKHIVDNTDYYDLEEYEKDFKTIFKKLNNFTTELKEKVLDVKIDISAYISIEELKNRLTTILSLTIIET